MNRRTAIIILAAVAAILVAGLAGLLAFSGSSGSDSGTSVAAESIGGVVPVNEMLADIPQQGDTIGDAAAPATVTEFLDLRCPACRQYSEQVIPSVVADLVRTGKAKAQMRVWPILGPDSESAAKAAYAAMKQDRLWTYAEIWYRNQKDERDTYATDEFVRAVATAAGLDVAQFDRDRASADAVKWYEETANAASAAGYTGTPAIAS